jgi:tryptophan synthase alpha chain
MLPRERIAAAIRGAGGAGGAVSADGGGPALVAFLTAGFPRRDGFREQLAEVAAGADVVEIGVPFTDPMADGMTIQRSSRAALAQGVTLQWILDELAAMERPRAPLLLMSYLNPLLSFGYEKLAATSVAAGVCGFIVPDLPLDEGDELRAALDRHGLALVQMVTPVTPHERLTRLCAASQGFVYAVTMTGTTGRNATMPADVLTYLARVRAAASVPVCAGFGIRTREQVEGLRGAADGAIVGSALVEVLERGESPRAFLAALRGGAPATA